MVINRIGHLQSILFLRIFKAYLSPLTDNLEVNNKYRFDFLFSTSVKTQLMVYIHFVIGFKNQAFKGQTFGYSK